MLYFDHNDRYVTAILKHCVADENDDYLEKGTFSYSCTVSKIHEGRVLPFMFTNALLRPDYCLSHSTRLIYTCQLNE